MYILKKKSRRAAEAEPRAAAAPRGMGHHGDRIAGQGVHPTHPSPPPAPSPDSCARVRVQKWGSENFCTGKGVCETINNFVVYKHTSPDGKVYIGVTGQNPETRWQGGFGYASNTYMFVDIVRFGWDNFEHEILASGLSKTDALKLEQELITAHHSNWPDKGYNVAAKQLKPRVVKPREDPRAEPTTVPRDPSEIRSWSGGGSTPKKVRCVELDIIYPSARAAARSIGVMPNSLRQAIAAGHRCHGYHWIFVASEEVNTDAE